MCVIAANMLYMVFAIRKPQPNATLHIDSYDVGNETLNVTEGEKPFVYYHSIAMEWNLVGAKASIPTMAVTVQMIGVLLGAGVSGYIGKNILNAWFLLKVTLNSIK